MQKIPLNKLEQIDKFKNSKIVNFSNKFTKIVNNLDYDNLKEFYLSITSNFNSQNILNEDIVKNNFKFKNQEIFNNNNISDLKKGFIIDQSNYISDDIFTKVDRSSMSNSLEVRCPLADVRLIEQFNCCQDNVKINKDTKLLLRKLLSRFIPEKLINRPKMGFGIPINKLLQNKLKNLLTDLLSKDSLDKSSIFNKNIVDNLMTEHLKNRKDNSQVLWSIMVFQLWYNKNFKL